MSARCVPGWLAMSAFSGHKPCRMHPEIHSRRSRGLTGGAGAADGDQRVVALVGEVVGAQEALLDVVQQVAMGGVCRALALQLEHDHAAARISTLSLADIHHSAYMRALLPLPDDVIWTQGTNNSLPMESNRFLQLSSQPE